MFRQLDWPVVERVNRKLVELKADPRPAGAKALKEWPGRLRVRVGDYRIVHTIDDAARSVHVERIGHRSTVYR
jgi:mRNA interferase RelE/StbE